VALPFFVASKQRNYVVFVPSPRAPIFLEVNELRVNRVERAWHAYTRTHMHPHTDTSACTEHWCVLQFRRDVQTNKHEVRGGCPNKRVETYRPLVRSDPDRRKLRLALRGGAPGAAWIPRK